MPWSRVFSALLLAGAALLAGCAGPRLVESDVATYSTLTALPQPATYRIERLPSQQTYLADFAPIEAQAEAALARVGLQRDDAHPGLIAQLGARAGVGWPSDWPYAGPVPFYGRFGWGMGWGRHAGFGLGMGTGWMMDAPPTVYRRQVSVVLRDAQSQRVVFESSAAYEDVWTSDPMIYGVLFDQALTDFPRPPQGPRKLRTELTPQP